MADAEPEDVYGVDLDPESVDNFFKTHFLDGTSDLNALFDQPALFPPMRETPPNDTESQQQFTILPPIRETRPIFDMPPPETNAPFASEDTRSIRDLLLEEDDTDLLNDEDVETILQQFPTNPNTNMLPLTPVPRKESITAPFLKKTGTKQEIAKRNESDRERAERTRMISQLQRNIEETESSSKKIEVAKGKPIGKTKSVRSSKGANPDRDLPITLSGISIESIKAATDFNEDRVAMIEGQLEPYKMLLELKQITGLLCTGAKMNVQKLNMHLRNSYFHSWHSSLHCSLTNPDCAIAVHERKGSIESMGCKNLEDLYISIKKMIAIINIVQPGHNIKFRKPLIMDLTCTFGIGHSINLMSIIKASDQFSVENFAIVNTNNKFPSIHMRDLQNGVNVQIFESGSMVFSLFRNPPKKERTREREVNISEKYDITDANNNPFSIPSIKLRMYETLLRLLPLLRADAFRK